MAGKPAFVLVAVMDIFKAWFSFWICTKLFAELKLAGIIGGVFCVLGHMFPAFLRFHGGKGFACLAYSPRVLLIMSLITLVIAVITNYACIVTSSMPVIFPLYYDGVTTHFRPGALVLAIPALPIILKHVENFRRIGEGSELRLSYLWEKDKELQRAGYKHKKSSVNRCFFYAFLERIYIFAGSKSCGGAVCNGGGELMDLLFPAVTGNKDVRAYSKAALVGICVACFIQRNEG